MPGTALGARRAAACRLGIPFDEYQARVSAGEKWCTACKSWHPVGTFGADADRPDGLTAACLDGRNALVRSRYTPRERPAPGRRFVEARDGDKEQARGRINHLVNVGLLPNPNDVACTDCGHIGDGPRHEYDHHLGYAAEHHEDVEAVCAPCHHTREDERRGR